MYYWQDQFLEDESFEKLKNQLLEHGFFELEHMNLVSKVLNLFEKFNQKQIEQTINDINIPIDVLLQYKYNYEPKDILSKLSNHKDYNELVQSGVYNVGSYFLLVPQDPNERVGHILFNLGLNKRSCATWDYELELTIKDKNQTYLVAFENSY